MPGVLGMMDDEFSAVVKSLRRELREIGEELDTLRKRKANGDDVDQISQKVSALETEVRLKFGTLQGQNGEMMHTLQNLLASVEALRIDITHQKREVNSLQDSAKGSMQGSLIQRIPMWSWVLMAIGLFALLQLGLERYAELKGVIS